MAFEMDFSFSKNWFVLCTSSFSPPVWNLSLNSFELELELVGIAFLSWVVRYCMISFIMVWAFCFVSNSCIPLALDQSKIEQATAFSTRLVAHALCLVQLF
jgi:hypothetical protein